MQIPTSYDTTNKSFFQELFYSDVEKLKDVWNILIQAHSSSMNEEVDFTVDKKKL